MATSKKKASTKKPTQEQKPEDLENQNQENASPSDQPAAAADSSPESEDQGNLDLSALDGIETEEVDQEAHREEKGPEPKKPQVVDAQKGREMAEVILAKGMNTTAAYVPELRSYFSNEMVNDGADKLGPVIVKHQGKLPPRLAQFFEKYEEEFWCGVWFSGVAVGGYLHVKAVKASEQKSQGDDNGSE